MHHSHCTNTVKSRIKHCKSKTPANRRRRTTATIIRTHCHIGFINSLLRTTLLIAFGLANLNNGLTAYETTATNSSSTSSSESWSSGGNDGSLFSDRTQIQMSSKSKNAAQAEQILEQEHHQHQHQPHHHQVEPQQEQTNQNLIMPTTSAFAPSARNALPMTAALTAEAQLPFGHTHVDALNMPMPYPSSSITATSTLFQPHSMETEQQQQQQLQQHHQQTSGRSIIKSFDSINVIDDAQMQQSTSQHQQHSHTNYPNSIARPLHKVIGLHNPTAGGGGSIENHLDDGDGADPDSVFGTPMYFGTENSTVVSTQIGATAHIPCTVHHIGDGVVSWIRRKDYHLLTVGLASYTNDERFSATHLKGSEDWTLQIKFVQLRDAGVYECQVSTHPPTSIFLHLNVVEARAEISGPPIRYLTPGSTLRLQCRVVQNTEASEFIFWYHDNRMINYDIDRGINVSTEPDFQSSELTIMRTRREHSGNFTCVASNTQPASVLVHIFKGDNPAAMYHGHVGSSTKTYQTHMHHYMALIAIGYRIFHINLHIKIV